MRDEVLALTPEEYWRWRLTIEEMKTAKQNLSIATLKHKLLTKEAEIANVQAMLFARTYIQPANDKVEEAKKEYDKVKSELEKRIGVSLNGKMIDDFTFEVKDVPKE